MSESLPEFSLDDTEDAESPNYVPTEREQAIAQDLVSLNKQMEAFQEEIAKFNIARQGIGSSMEVLEQQINALRKQDREIKEKQFDIQRELRKIESEKDSKARLLEQEREQRNLRLELTRQAEEFDRLTMNAPWREWAMDHQIKGAKIMATAKRGLLGDKRGLGKTLTALIYADMLQAKKIIYFSPGDVIRTVEREIHHWAPHRMVAPLGMMPKKQRRAMLDVISKLDSYVITINYEAWRKDFSLLEDIAKLRVDTVILDEAHGIKDKKSIAFRGVEKIVFAANQCPECDGGPVEMAKSQMYSYMEVPTCRNCGNQAERSSGAYDWCSIKNVLPMTGTPILNKPQDLFTMLTLIDRHNFYNENQYLRDYCTQDMYTGKWKFRTGGLDRLISQLSSKFLVRDRHSAGITIPKQEIQYYDLDLDPNEYPEQFRYAQQLNKYAQIMLDEDKAINILYVIALITRKRQMMTWPAGIKWVDQKTKEVLFEVDCNESVKVDRVIKFVNTDVNEWQGLLPELTADGNMEEGERVVLFSQFKEPLKEIERRCQAAGISVVRYDGDTPKDVQDQVVVDFDRKHCEKPEYNNGNGPKWQVVLANYKKGGVGLNLTAATQVIVLDEEWNPGKVDQAYGRVDRMGQTEETTVHVLRVKNSIDTWMASIIAEKAEMIDGFESKQSLAQEMLDAIRNGDMI